MKRMDSAFGDDESMPSTPSKTPRKTAKRKAGKDEDGGGSKKNRKTKGSAFLLTGSDDERDERVKLEGKAKTPDRNGKVKAEPVSAEDDEDEL
jgi:hypothetical protein